jgi:hypothetical protein
VWNSLFRNIFIPPVIFSAIIFYSSCNFFKKPGAKPTTWIYSYNASVVVG